MPQGPVVDADRQHQEQREARGRGERERQAVALVQRAERRRPCEAPVRLAAYRRRVIGIVTAPRRVRSADDRPIAIAVRAEHPPAQPRIRRLVRDPLDDQQTSGVRFALVVEWTEGDGAQALAVPDVKQFMTRELEPPEVRLSRASRPSVRHEHGGIAVLETAASRGSIVKWPPIGSARDRQPIP